MPFIMWRGRRRWIDDDDEESSESSYSTSSSESETSTSELSSISSEYFTPTQEQQRILWDMINRSRQQPMKKVKPAPLKNLMGPPERKRKITLEE